MVSSAAVSYTHLEQFFRLFVDGGACGAPGGGNRCIALGGGDDFAHLAADGLRVDDAVVHSHGIGAAPDFQHRIDQDGAVGVEDDVTAKVRGETIRNDLHVIMSNTQNRERV